MKRTLWIVPLILIIGLVVYNSITKSNAPPPPNPNELVTITIPSKISNNKLMVTLPRCAFDTTHTDGNGQISIIYLAFRPINYSGNLKNEFHCPTPVEKDLLNDGEIVPIYPMIKTGEKFSGDNYFYANNKQWNNFTRAKNDSVQIVANGVTDILHFMKMPNQTHPLQVKYYHGSAEEAKKGYVSTLSYLYRAETVIHDEFLFRYSYFILVPENRHGYNLPDYDTQFAEDHRNVERQSGNILEHPDILQGFVDNNERVVKFINAHTMLVKA